MTLLFSRERYREIAEAYATLVLTDLAAAGVQVSLDDFGQGQTSLAYLSALPLDEIKIDRSFVSDLRKNDTHAAIVRSLIELGHNLGLRVVAEGIETPEILTDLGSHGCDLAQGYHIARPMPLEALFGWLHDRPTSPVAWRPPPYRPQGQAASVRWPGGSGRAGLSLPDIAKAVRARTRVVGSRWISTAVPGRAWTILPCS